MANKGSIFLESTSLTPARACSTITETLARIPGIESVSSLMEQGSVSEIRFTVAMGAALFSFLLRPNPEGVKRQYSLFHKRGTMSQEHATKVAWAQLTEWVKVQAAMIEGGQSTIIDSFLPKLEAGNGSTMAEWFLGGGYKQLAAGPAPEPNSSSR